MEIGWRGFLVLELAKQMPSALETEKPAGGEAVFVLEARDRMDIKLCYRLETRANRNLKRESRPCSFWRATKAGSVGSFDRRSCAGPEELRVMKAKFTQCARLVRGRLRPRAAPE